LARTSARVLGLTAALSAGTLALMPLGSPLVDPSALPVSLPWWTLIPAFLAVMLLPISYEVRGEVRNVSLTQLALAVGLVFVSPWLLLLARVLVAAAYSVPIRRHPPTQAAVNNALCGFEVATAVAIASFFAPLSGPGPEL
jgi:hypothetical protein